MVLNQAALKRLVKEQQLSGVNDFNRIMGEITKEVVEIFLEGELTDHLGYEKYDHKGKETDNSRNGSSPKTVNSKFGKLELSVPRDRQSEFEPQLVKKGDRDITGMEEKVLSMYARGMSTRDISSHVQEIYNYSLSAETVSQITEGVLDQGREWQNRPLEAIYAVVFLDGLVMKAKVERKVGNVTVYNILGITLEGKKECLGLWLGGSESESASYWMSVLTELQNRGVKDVLIFSVDNLSGISEAISGVFPQSEIQKCIVHQIRNSSKFVSYKDRKELSLDLKKIYKAVTEEQGRSGLEDFDQKWGKKYPHVVSSWQRNWGELSTFFKYPPEIRLLIYTTNPIESMNRGLRKVTKTKGVFPNKESIFKILYLAVERMNKKWKGRLSNWSVIYPQLLVYFGERVQKYLKE
jgi:transposase-like protein